MKTIKPGTLFCDEFGDIYEYAITLNRYKKNSFNYEYLYAHILLIKTCESCDNKTSVNLTEKQFQSLYKIGKL